MIITLIGMPGCGKSCMGKAISGKLKMKNIDTDTLIEKQNNKKLWQLIDELGLEGFKELERKTLLDFNTDNVILSTGGSAVYYDDAMQHLKSLGKVVYLKVDLPIIKSRLGDFTKRGIVLKPGETIDDLFMERSALYSKYADIIVNCSGNAYPKYQAEVINWAKSFLE